ncbi:MAG: tRNA pseudouridine(55) synthase TruB [Lachnospiraceae bacterium]|nr:tRNA pseudouridine(55) synthase TruB [Lachnospiraceae bacterium]
MISGVINIYKEEGFTSFDVVARLRGILKQKKIGHTGTLDPAATGVLPVCLGMGTRLVEHLTDKTKEYVCEMRLGVTTDTEDMTGTVITQREVTCTEEEVREVCESFVKTYEQIPPMYSAIRQDGKHLYELAREGVVVERKGREVTILALEIQKIALPFVTMRIECSKGTYIRSLCRDIGEALKCGASMEKLERTRSGEFTKDTALTLEQVQQLMQSGRVEEYVLPIEHFYEDYRALHVRLEEKKRIDNGNPLTDNCFREQSIRPQDGEFFRVYNAELAFCAIYRYSKERGNYRPENMFF